MESDVKQERQVLGKRKENRPRQVEWSKDKHPHTSTSANKSEKKNKNNVRECIM